MRKGDGNCGAKTAMKAVKIIGMVSLGIARASCLGS